MLYLIQWTFELFLWGKTGRDDINNSASSSTEVIPLVCLHGVNRKNFTFTFFYHSKETVFCPHSICVRFLFDSKKTGLLTL